MLWVKLRKKKNQLESAKILESTKHSSFLANTVINKRTVQIVKGQCSSQRTHAIVYLGSPAGLEYGERPFTAKLNTKSAHRVSIYLNKTTLDAAWDGITSYCEKEHIYSLAIPYSPLSINLVDDFCRKAPKQLPRIFRVVDESMDIARAEQIIATISEKK
ncbi:uncharacterized protein [Clytia hemisphaerica]|uniref:uncharacterized protein n=1 Tax=Clytia hemisphaerica TaxID=252671 RepID=UPI0034D775F2